MTRKPKYRVWDPKYKKMYPWDEIIYFNHTNYICVLSVEAGRMLVGGEFLEFTGLLDKRGKEIYEGDILRVKGKQVHDSIVTWSPEDGAWLAVYVHPLTGTKEHNLAYVYDKYTVFGNIYENPELPREGQG